MSALAFLIGARRPSRVHRPAIRPLLSLVAGIGAVLTAAPASAQPTVTLSVTNDYRLRGYTLSEGRPAAALDLSYDHSSGLYLGISAIGVLAEGAEPRPLGLQESFGYARRLPSGLTIDAGITNANYTHYAIGRQATRYTEVYLGLLGRGLSSHIFYSPHYLYSGLHSIYGEVDGVLRPADHWRVNWHVGAQRLRSDRYHYAHTYADWRLGLTREFGRTQAQIAVSRGGRGPRPPAERDYGRTAIVATLTHSF